MGKIEDTKDKVVGRVMETAGKITNDQELEFTGKFRTLTSQAKDKVEDKIEDIKEDVYQEANKLADRAGKKLNQQKK